MLLKNNAKRLITINTVGRSYDILPGLNPSVSVPDEVCKTDYVKALINCGDLIVQVEDDSPAAKEAEAEEAEETEEPDAEAETETSEKEELANQAKALGIEVDKRWGVSRLKAEIDKALAE